VGDVLVLGYHGISDRWPAVTAVTPAAFGEHMRSLAARGYRGATFRQSIAAGRRGKVVAVTFDDAHRSVFEHAWPVLRELGWPATVFVPTEHATLQTPMGWAGNEEWVGGPWEHELACMTWEELCQLADAGWEVGSHTRTHPRLTRISPEELHVELEESRAEVERRVGRLCDTVAYPYGDVDDVVAAAASAAGYRAGAGAPAGLEEPVRPMRWPRVMLDRTHVGRRFALRTDARVRWLARTVGARYLARRRAAA
jgi:peptidoglycan/xylan/chitin deacetylase (PgdA/CDA1 family)